jgi:outer membrane lipoprotein-sorting protein
MKKILFISALMCSFVLTGCSKNYKSVDEYSEAMKAVRDANVSYTIEAKQKTGTVELYIRTFIKGDKWKAETSMNGGLSYTNTTLYDGKDLLVYSAGSPFAVTSPDIDMSGKADIDTKKKMINLLNPLYGLFDWKDGFNVFSFSETASPVFVNKKDKKNGFECRLISFPDDREVCVNDKYGIAVYQKMSLNNAKQAMYGKEIVHDVVIIDTSEIADSVFKLSPGVKRMDVASVLDSFSDILE